MMKLPLTVRWMDNTVVGEVATESREVSSRGLYFYLPKVLKSGSAVEIVLAARRAGDMLAAIVASSGSGQSSDNQPRSIASRRSAVTLRRPISRDRAICRSVSPWRRRTMTCRY